MKPSCGTEENVMVIVMVMIIVVTMARLQHSPDRNSFWM